MMVLRRIISVLKSDWTIAFCLLCVFLLTNGYKYNWDDQHIEIPLLKSLIDPHLYSGDYYVESLKKNFTSFLFPLLARVISLQQVPSAYFVLFLLSRYFLFYWLYKFWKHLSGERMISFFCVSFFILIGRVPEFLYRTFSHQEFALAFIAAGFYFFYKDRFLLASAILGVAANFHALYALFPMIYILVFLLLRQQKAIPAGHGATLERNQYRWNTFLKSTIGFIVCALPFLVWTAKRLFLEGKVIDPQIYDNWYELYKITCPQNFVFLEIPLDSIFKDMPSFMQAVPRYLILTVLYMLNWLHNESFRNDRRVKAVALSTIVLLGISFFFTYVQPSRFVLDLNLVRNTQYLALFLMGYAFMTVFRMSTRIHLGGLAFVVLMLYLIGFGDLIGTLSLLAATGGMVIFRPSTDEGQWRFSWEKFLALLITLIALGGIIYLVLIYKIRPAAISNFYTAAGLISFAFFVILAWPRVMKKIPPPWILIIIPIFFTLIQYSRYHWERRKIERMGLGFWQLQRDWEDMQKFVQKNTPVDALFLVPNDMEMGGFRILSERKIICCYRDCGIVGFDYQSGKEWQQRLLDIETFKVRADQSIKPALVSALIKYRVNYIVFMRYYAPKASAPELTHIYENGSFSLFKVNYQ